MLLIHWTKHKNTTDMLKNGIRPKMRKKKIPDVKEIKGVWCYPYTRNKSLNNTWKSNLKTWRNDTVNFNGLVFKLEDSDFPIYAGDCCHIGYHPERAKFNNRAEFLNEYGEYLSPKKLDLELNEETMREIWPDYVNFEIIIPNRIEAKRIIKLIKDRNTLPKRKG